MKFSRISDIITYQLLKKEIENALWKSQEERIIEEQDGLQTEEYVHNKEERDEAERIYQAVEQNKMKYKTSQYDNYDLDQLKKEYIGKYLIGKNDYLYIKSVYNVDNKRRHINMIYNQRIEVISIWNSEKKNILNKHDVPFIIQKDMWLFELEYYEFCSQEEFETNQRKVVNLIKCMTGIDGISKKYKK